MLDLLTILLLIGVDVGYAVLDGFDLGAGTPPLPPGGTSGDRHRRHRPGLGRNEVAPDRRRRPRSPRSRWSMPPSSGFYLP
jgi:hypothetical protein